MKFVILPRAGGKTTIAVRWLADTPKGILVTSTAMERDRLIKECIKARGGGKAYGRGKAYWERRIITSDQRIGTIRGSSRGTVLAFDNLDIILQLLFGYPVDLVTFTGEPRDIYSKSEDELNDEHNRTVRGEMD